MESIIDLFKVKFYDGSQRIVEYSLGYSIDPFNTKGKGLRVSFEYIGPEQIEVTHHLIGWLNNRFLTYFNTNQFLWQISVLTCPEELQPYLILPDSQLTYKGTN